MSAAPAGAARLRQVVIAAAERDPVADALQRSLGLRAPYEDPGVGLFGLHNAVFALGDQFLEVIAPTQEGTAVGRWRRRTGADGGYMLIVQLDDLAGARARAREMGVRTAWEIDLPDIAATHLHPADTGGALLSLDRPDPPGSWRWGGPDWTGRTGTGAAGAITGVHVRAPDPAGTAARWGRLLGRAPAGDGTTLALDDATVTFTAGPDLVTAVDVALPAGVRAGREHVAVGGVTFRLRDLPSA